MPIAPTLHVDATTLEEMRAVVAAVREWSAARADCIRVGIISAAQFERLATAEASLQIVVDALEAE